MITGHAQATGISIEVGVGGGLRALTLTERSMRLGRAALADEILTLVRIATARANEQARHTLGDEHLETLGLHLDAELSEEIESITPESWMVR
ncbi:YbaB/EbfC family DNA-binding protein [Lentzea sp. NEAU-D7]|uniref:YbaB/EbfC family DNA-binding protein n=1 Tax=Lentzea sp. NEAU-D7 TaxID=2994667 RepID=UPI00224B4140|nr:YbaB/EbfC family DNA-binding protein [Lentzea sp. NEAU-D7]MCX2951580.1 YbaB/EbfC family DNA-binding protein [Lentzea sp. NEAU-D7]